VDTLNELHITGLGFLIQWLMVERRNVFVVIECRSKYLITLLPGSVSVVNVLSPKMLPTNNFGIER
jgi:hypothetical protein